VLCLKAFQFSISLPVVVLHSAEMEKVEEAVASDEAELPLPLPITLVRVMRGNMFGSSAQTLVNTVNCVGVMGKGVALRFKKMYPAMFRDYAARCRRKEVKLGEPYLFRLIYDRQIINFPTKDHWRQKSDIHEVERGLKYLVDHAKEWNIKSIVLPALGCTNGGLDWEQVRPLMIEYLSQLDIPVEIYEPSDWNAPDGDVGKLVM
jgi:O-acetyl-ADP-ribose deacetylase (regulator of RNase III)